MEFTPDQQKAIDFGGNSILVSAAAGSGKTAVLTERVIKKLLSDNPVMLDRMLILTYTNAAADEMKTRIGKSLLEKILQDPQNKTLRAQLSLLPSAQISTIHSACLTIIRENFEALGLDPRFRVGDESKLLIQKKETLAEFVETLYENRDTDPDAKIVINELVHGRDDNPLFETLDNVSYFLEEIPYCERFVDDAVNADFRALALSELKEPVKKVVCGYRDLMSIAPPEFIDKIQEEYDALEKVYGCIEADDYDSAADLSAVLPFQKNMRHRKSFSVDADEWKEYTDTRALLKKQYTDITDSFMYAHSDIIKADREKEVEFLSAVFNLSTRLNKILLEKRRADRLVSFGDIEKYTLSLLVESFDGKDIVKTELARELSARYDEIIVDEYQDCNETQDLIFRALSDDGKNIFTVGDVKQSIYRFRGAQPKLFLNKQNEYSLATKNPLDCPSKINLSCNFRSHPVILSFVNRIFNRVMTKERAIDYSDGHELYPSHLFDSTDAAGVDVTVIVDSDTQKLTRAPRLEVEAKYVAAKIKEIIGNREVTIYDAKNECERMIEARDIAILLAKPGKIGSVFEAALTKEGIEFQNNNPSEKYLEAPEVRGAVAFLQAIDNPYDDIMLISAMYAGCFGFDANELGTIRAINKYVSFYDALKISAKTDKKSADFIDMLTGLRNLSLTCTVYDLIGAMYEKSGMLQLAKDEKERANLILLSELAASFESDGYKGLYSFINYLEALGEKSEKLPSARLKATDDCVNILSIHHSKGLEYPVVFLCDCGAELTRASKGMIVYDRDFGAGSKINDEKTHREFSGIMRTLAGKNKKREEIFENIRLLYVALTRAQSRLYITGSMGAKEADDMVKSCIVDGASAIDEKPSYLKWITAGVIDTENANDLYNITDATMEHNDKCSAQIRVVFANDVLDAKTQEVVKAERESAISKDEVIELITRVPDCVSDAPAKLSVSEIKAVTSGNIKVSADRKKPRFLQGGATGADRGSATHKFLQFCDFNSIFDIASFEKEKERLVCYEFITKTEAALTDGQKIVEFLTSDTMKELLKSGKFYKERRFMFTLPANELGMAGDDEIIIQGVLDCYFVTGDGAVIVDYKTDRVSSEFELIDRYRIQLDMYEKALMITEGIPTCKKYIYSFALSRFILV